MAGSDYTIRTVSHQADLPSLELDWNRLSGAAVAPNVFTTFGWFQAWSEQLVRDNPSGNIRPHVLVLSKGETVAGICPLMYRQASRFGLSVRKLEFAGVHADYNDLVIGADQDGLINVIAEYLAHASAHWDVLDLRDLRDAGGGKTLIERAFSNAGLFLRTSPEQEGCPYMAIDGNAAHLMKRLSGHVRRTLRRRSERAAIEGSTIQIIENPQDEPRLLKTLVELDWKKHLHKASPAFIGAYPEVFQSLFESLGPHGWLYVALLELKGIPIAFQFGFRCGGKLWDYTKAYDRAFSRFAPGTLLLPAILDYGFEHDYHEYDFLRGEEPYKIVWTAECHRQFRLFAWSSRRTSRIVKFIYHDVKTAIYRLCAQRPSQSSNTED